jgi:hypothetical protein
LSCPICRLRKEKRFCLALHDRICGQCCGEQREVTLDCPSECPYLHQARQHEKPRDVGEDPPEEMFPAVHLREDLLERHEPLIGGVLQTLGELARADRDLHDRELIGALANLAKSYQTLATSGLLYQEALPNPAQEAIISAVQQLFEEFRQIERKHRGYTTLKDGDAFQAIVFILRLAHLNSSGKPLARGFIDFLKERFPVPEGLIASQGDVGSRIILP